jgi:hypothetical protein
LKQAENRTNKYFHQGKTRKNLFDFFIWWSVIGAGIYVGGTLFMMVVIDPKWTGNPPESVHFFFGQSGFNKYIGHFFAPKPAVVIGLLPLSLALISGWYSKLHRRYLLIAISSSLIVLIFTIAYIYPINAILITKAGGDKSAEEIKSMVAHWVFADRLRFVIYLVGYFFLLKAFRKTTDKPGNEI